MFFKMIHYFKILFQTENKNNIINIKLPIFLYLMIQSVISTSNNVQKITIEELFTLVELTIDEIFDNAEEHIIQGFKNLKNLKLEKTNEFRNDSMISSSYNLSNMESSFNEKNIQPLKVEVFQNLIVKITRLGMKILESEKILLNGNEVNEVGVLEMSKDLVIALRIDNCFTMCQEKANFMSQAKLAEEYVNLPLETIKKQQESLATAKKTLEKWTNETIPLIINNIKTFLKRETSPNEYCNKNQNDKGVKKLSCDEKMLNKDMQIPKESKSIFFKYCEKFKIKKESKRCKSKDQAKKKTTYLKPQKSVEPSQLITGTDQKTKILEFSMMNKVFSAKNVEKKEKLVLLAAELVKNTVEGVNYWIKEVERFQSIIKHLVFIKKEMVEFNNLEPLNEDFLKKIELVLYSVHSTVQLAKESFISKNTMCLDFTLERESLSFATGSQNTEIKSEIQLNEKNTANAKTENDLPKEEMILTKTSSNELKNKQEKITENKSSNDFLEAGQRNEEKFMISLNQRPNIPSTSSIIKPLQNSDSKTESILEAESKLENTAINSNMNGLLSQENQEFVRSLAYQQHQSFQKKNFTDEFNGSRETVHLDKIEAFFDTQQHEINPSLSISTGLQGSYLTASPFQESKNDLIPLNKINITDSPQLSIVAGLQDLNSDYLLSREPINDERTLKVRNIPDTPPQSSICLIDPKKTELQELNSNPLIYCDFTDDESTSRVQNIPDTQPQPSICSVDLNSNSSISPEPINDESTLNVENIPDTPPQPLIYLSDSKKTELQESNSDSLLSQEPINDESILNVENIPDTQPQPLIYLSDSKKSELQESNSDSLLSQEVINDESTLKVRNIPDTTQPLINLSDSKKTELQESNSDSLLSQEPINDESTLNVENIPDTTQPLINSSDLKKTELQESNLNLSPHQDSKLGDIPNTVQSTTNVEIQETEFPKPQSPLSPPLVPKVHSNSLKEDIPIEKETMSGTKIIVIISTVVVVCVLVIVVLILLLKHGIISKLY